MNAEWISWIFLHIKESSFTGKHLNFIKFSPVFALLQQMESQETYSKMQSAYIMVQRQWNMPKISGGKLQGCKLYGTKKKPGILTAGMDLPHVWGVWMSTDDCEVHGSAPISCTESLSYSLCPKNNEYEPTCVRTDSSILYYSTVES